jgi:Kef-type K+ transport system membrane component KefB
LLLLAIVVAAAKLAGAAATRAGQPAVFGEILAGLLLGPTVLDVLGWPVFYDPAASAAVAESHRLLASVRDLAHVGVILLMFVAGLETDVDEMRRVGRVASWAALGGVLLPFFGGIAVAAAFGIPAVWEGVFIGTILTATSVSISAQTLIELGALRSKAGSTILGAAVIDDVMGIVILSVVVAFAQATGDVDYVSILLVAARMIAFFAAAIVAGRLLEGVARGAAGLRVSQALLAMVLTVTFVYAWAAEYLGGVAAITGSYLAGVLFGRTPFKDAINDGVHPLTYSMFVPVFFISIGLEANGRDLGPRLGFTLALLLVAIVAKAAGCGLFARIFGFTPRESVQVGLGMISRGEVGLIVASYGLGRGIIGSDVFSASVIMVLGTTMMTPPLLRVAFPREHRPVPVVVEETIAGPPEEAEEHR